MKGRRISVLGSGWLGAALVAILEAKGSSVLISTTSSEKCNQLKGEGKQAFTIKVQSEEIIGDIESFLDSEILIINIPPNRAELEKEQFASLLPLIEKSSIQKVLFVSSTAVYPNLNRVLKEDEKIENKTHHLYKSEQLLLNNLHFKTTVVRMAGLVGGERHPGRFFRKHGVIRNAEAPVNLIHREDCLQIMLQIMLQDVWGEVFNACADEHPPKNVFYPTAAAAIGMPVPLCEAADSPSFKIIDNTKIKEQLSIHFKYPDLLRLIKEDKWV
ncbi:Rossmann-fold NAD(P)-binding domain-containing protein [Aureispira anguillae]|uniref:Nucleoside-diphosphate-sugar epimerase n=1 Tax=Aureispira anguillae TaxID=2864201 RepID=A0A916DWG9_9BACT|nr:hypothetical protein [Aureispira anguillae]BDS14787.1 hypothetical protein AsAng_0055690 [Aureispira anguillae]